MLLEDLSLKPLLLSLILGMELDLVDLESQDIDQVSVLEELEFLDTKLVMELEVLVLEEPLNMASESANSVLELLNTELVTESEESLKPLVLSPTWAPMAPSMKPQWSSPTQLDRFITY